MTKATPPFLIESSSPHQKIGRFSFHNGGFSLSAPEGIEIGSFCAFAPNVSILGSNHDYNYTALQYSFYTHFFDQCHPSFRVSRTRAGSKGKITIGSDVWLGQNVVVLGGVNIGNGAIVGANAVVTKDVAPYTLVAGVPAKEIKKRFSDDTIAFLEDLKWWS
ncbi:CatB-related O-acetyltransferase, partial [Candidatus Saccharibacteria bacterium]|nr:CatB-related O-acetyltransferase [Candidatus Saccharibacteria bacterium]